MNLHKRKRGEGLMPPIEANQIYMSAIPFSKVTRGGDYILFL